MPFSHLSRDSYFGPTVLEAMRNAFELVCTQLEISANDVLASRVATDIIALATTGERDVDILAKRAIDSMGLLRERNK